MKIENISISGFQDAIRGMRNPKASWDRIDSEFIICHNNEIESKINEGFVTIPNTMSGRYVFMGKLGLNDTKLIKALVSGGTEHRKFLRQIQISMDVTAPGYWWKEFATYKVGTTSNSTSTMHKLADTPITLSSFEMDDYIASDIYHTRFINDTVEHLEYLRLQYVAKKDMWYWKELIRWLPYGFNFKRTVTFSYENALAMIHQRKSHKLTEWKNVFVPTLKNLPFMDTILSSFDTEESETVSSAPAAKEQPIVSIPVDNVTITTTAEIPKRTEDKPAAAKERKATITGENGTLNTELLSKMYTDYKAKLEEEKKRHKEMLETEQKIIEAKKALEKKTPSAIERFKAVMFDAYNQPKMSENIVGKHLQEIENIFKEDGGKTIDSRVLFNTQKAVNKAQEEGKIHGCTGYGTDIVSLIELSTDVLSFVGEVEALGKKYLKNVK